MAKDFLGGLFDDLIGSAAKPEKGVKLHGKLIDGAYYIRAEDVADLLKVNGLLPNTEAKLREATRK